MGVKDVIDVAGLPTRAGSRVLDDEPIPTDAPVIKRLRDAGALIIGKTTTHEFASGLTTPPTRNPWDTNRISGGSGAAVAAGECIAALGTDSGGSIRIPAAFCGVSGLRPRRGTVPMKGIIPFSWTHDTCGPIARTAMDLAFIWQVMADDAKSTANVSIPEIRVGVLHPLQSILQVEPEIEDATYGAISILELGGARRHDVQLPPFKEWDVARRTVVVSDMLAAHQDAGWFPQRVNRYSDEVVSFLRMGQEISGADLVLARRKLEELGQQFLNLFDNVDVVLVPTAIRTAPTVVEAESKAGPGQPPPLVPDVMRATGPIGWCGLASVSVPSGFASDGLPLGLQFVAVNEWTALSTAARFQTLTNFHEARPPLDLLYSA
jgi:aspartyl-tRNA(Asn)/glutamyl-tRNA(Gln) amidotransferase subunit A